MARNARFNRNGRRRAPRQRQTRGRSRRSARSVVVSRSNTNINHSSNPSGGDTIRHLVTGKKSLLKGKKVKIAKLSKPMRKAIEHVFEKKPVVGVYKNIFTHALFTPADNLQSITALRSGATCDGDDSGFFSYGDITHMASVLFNSKTDSTTHNYGDVDNFDPRSLTFKIMNSYVAHTIRNNTTAEVKLRMYTFAPKGLCDDLPYDVWNNSYVQALSAGFINSGLTIGTLNEGPTKFAAVRSLFNIVCVQFVLGPGQTKVCYTQGPRDFEFNGFGGYSASASSTTSTYHYDKFSRHVIITCENNISGSVTAGAAGRYTDVSYTAGFAVHVENVVYYKIAMPEKAGFVYPVLASVAAGDVQPMLNRVNTYHVYNYSPAQGGAIAQVNEGFDANAITPRQ